MANNVLPNPLPVEMVKPILPTTAFGALHTEARLPVVQMVATYGTLSKAFTLVTGGGSAVEEESLFKVQSDGTAGSIGVLLSNRYLTYRAGQGLVSSFTAQFSAGEIGCDQAAGLITSTDGFTFGYVGEDYGILYTHHGEVEIQELIITTPSAGIENATVTINGTGYTVPLTGSGIGHDAAEIAESLTAQAFGFTFSSNENTVVCNAVLSAPLGSFAFTSGTAVAAWTQINAGVNVEEDFIPQAQWNQDIAAWINPLNLNVYQIQMQYLGAGGIDFFVEDSETADFLLVHRIEYANTANRPSASNPSFRCGWSVRTDAPCAPKELSGASVAGFIEGIKIRTEESRAADSTILALSTTETNLLTIRSRSVLDGKQNRVETLMLSVSAFTESNKAAVLIVRKNATFTGDVLIYEYVDKIKSTSEIATDPAIVTGGDVITATIMTTAGVTLNLKNLLLELLPNEALTFSARQLGTPATIASLALSYNEDL